jgi:tyrosinase
MATMNVRKDATTLSPAERTAFVNALLALKKTGTYDKFVELHSGSMMQIRAFANEPQDMNYRNAAHSGPVFLPWHRKLLLAFEAELRTVDPSVTLPYWNWNADARLPNPATSPIWAADFLGGDGTGPHGEVETGPFAGSTGNWPIAKNLDDGQYGPNLVRSFAILVPTLPTDEHVHFLMREQFYDVPPWCPVSPTGFRNRLEGWLNKRQDYRYWLDGSQMHNRVHLWIGGHMTANTSPNEPAFWLNHAYVDKLWSDWQKMMINSMPGMEMARSDFFVPAKDGPPGHNLDDKLAPWNDATLRDMLDPATLGYQYDTDADGTIRAFFTPNNVRRSARRFSLD